MDVNESMRKFYASIEREKLEKNIFLRLGLTAKPSLSVARVTTINGVSYTSQTENTEWFYGSVKEFKAVLKPYSKLVKTGEDGKTKYYDVILPDLTRISVYYRNNYWQLKP